MLPDKPFHKVMRPGDQWHRLNRRNPQNPEIGLPALKLNEGSRSKLKRTVDWAEVVLRFGDKGHSMRLDYEFAMNRTESMRNICLIFFSGVS